METVFQFRHLTQLRLSVLKAISRFIGLTSEEVWGVRCLCALCYLISTGFREWMCTFTVSSRGPRSVRGLWRYALAHVCLCCSVYMCLYLTMILCKCAFEPGHPQAEGSWEVTLRKTWVGTDYTFSHPLGSRLGFPAESCCDDQWKATTIDK